LEIDPPTSKPGGKENGEKNTTAEKSGSELYPQCCSLGYCYPTVALFARPDFQAWAGLVGPAMDVGVWTGRLLVGLLKTAVILWVAHTIACMFHVLPQWERLVLLRLGKSVGARGPGFFVVPPFLYSVARIIDVRITTYEVKATKTLTRDNIPIDVTAAVESGGRGSRKGGC